MKMETNTVCNYSKEDIYKNLDNINNWINNCDTKASIVLGLNGVILSIIFTNSGFLTGYTSIFKKIFHGMNFSDVLYMGFTIYSIVILVIGLYKLIRVLLPTLKINSVYSKPSYTYFGDIAGFSSDLEFKISISKQNAEDVLDDLLSQVYINSVICNNKFNSFKTGLKYSLIGFILIIILFVIGLLVY